MILKTLLMLLKF